MQLKQLLTEDRAVSPVIGVILMVAITVILAAVIGTFVLGLGSNVQSTPSASMSWDYTNDSDTGYHVEATHDGGDELNTDNSENVQFVYSDTSDAPVRKSWLNAVGDGNIRAGDSFNGTVNGTDEPAALNSEVRIVWTQGDNSATLATGEVPS